MFFISAKRRHTLQDFESLGLPILQIQTNKNKQIKRKDKYLGANYFLSDGNNNFSGRCKIRGHGNSTWNTILTQKRPYLLKLDSPESLLGFSASRKWILMANACDRSMLRNFYAEYLTHNVWNKMRWCPRSKFIMLFVNGKCLGLYGLTEKIDIADGRVEFYGEGFIVEKDGNKSEQEFTTDSGMQFNIRQPSGISQEDFERYAAKFREMESILFSENFKSEDGYKKYFDLDSFVDWYLLSEFSKNYDSAFRNSVFMNYDFGLKRLFMGPAWDYDIAFGNTNHGSLSNLDRNQNSFSDQFEWLSMLPRFDFSKNSNAPKNAEGFLINQTAWYKRLFQDEEFVTAVKKRWQETRTKLEESFEWIYKQGEALQNAAELNDEIWHILESVNWPRANGYRSRKTYMSEVDFFVDWCEQRMAWLDEIFSN